MQSMPCPLCGALVPRADIGSHKQCDSCHSWLRVYVPLFRLSAMPYGWTWAPSEEPSEPAARRLMNV